MPLTLDASPRSAFARYLPDTLPDDRQQCYDLLTLAMLTYNAAMKRPIDCEIYTDEIHLHYADDHRLCPARYIYL